MKKQLIMSESGGLGRLFKTTFSGALRADSDSRCNSTFYGLLPKLKPMNKCVEAMNHATKFLIAALVLGLAGFVTQLRATTIFSDNFDSENGGVGQLNYIGFANWNVTSGAVDLIGNGFYDYQPGHGLYLDMDGTATDQTGTIETKVPLVLSPGDYTLSFLLAGNQRGSDDLMTASVPGFVTQTYTLHTNDQFATQSLNFTVLSPTAVSIVFAGLPPADQAGLLLDDVKLELEQVCQKKLALMVNSTLDSEAGLYTIQADGSGLTKLLSVPASPHGGGVPRWSPDGMKIVFDAEFDGNDEIYVINGDGTGLEQLTFDPAQDRDPAWSPDGTMIVFSSNRGGMSHQDLFVMNADGSNIANLTNSPASDEYAPDWSPEGTQIVFDRCAGGKPSDLWLMNADGSGQRDLTLHTKAYTDGSGRWLLDGTKLIFTSTRMKNGEIFMMNSDGTGVTALTNNTAYNYGATTWSHQDGSLEIAFASRRSGSSGIYTTNGDGTHQKAIFLTSASDNLSVDARR